MMLVVVDWVDQTPSRAASPYFQDAVQTQLIPTLVLPPKHAAQREGLWRAGNLSFCRFGVGDRTTIRNETAQERCSSWPLVVCARPTGCKCQLWVSCGCQSKRSMRRKAHCEASR